MTLFEIHQTVPTSAIDNLGHVNNVIYLQWVQDVAEKHWNTRSTTTLREAYTWVVMEHHITYKKPAFANEELLLQTWVEGFGTTTSVRHTKVIRKSDDTLLVQAQTTWCLLNRTTNRPTRITEAVAGIFE